MNSHKKKRQSLIAVNLATDYNPYFFENESIILKTKPAAQVVMEYFVSQQNKPCSVNELLDYYLTNFANGCQLDAKKIRHAIYLKVNRMVKSGKLISLGKINKLSHYKLAENSQTDQTKSIITPTNNLEINTKKILLDREAELEYELEHCIAEAQGYEDLMPLLPNQLELLSSKKAFAKKKAIQLNGFLTSTRSVIEELNDGRS